ncbi:MAG: head GIN domain-containing protein [Bacteroidales bacterium]
MKKVKLYLASAVLFAVICFPAFSQTDSRETRNARNFSRISYGVPGTLYVSLGSEYKVVIEGRSDILREIETEVTGDRLVIKQRNWRFSMRDTRITVYVTMPEISGLSVSGSGRAEIKDPVTTGRLDLSVSGSGRLYTSKVDVKELKCSISGSGDIIMDNGGRADEADISISGSGNFTGESLTADEMSARISGSGSCSCNVSESLNASISGSGNITYSGNPRINARVSGSGRVRSR